MTLKEDALAGDDVKRGKDILAALSDELARRGVEPAEIGRLSRVSMWQSLTKDNEGEAHIHDLYGFQLSPSWDSGPAWPVLQPGPVVKVPGTALGKRYSHDGQIVTLVLPDMQIGYFRSRAGELVAVHDESAIDVALELIVASRPDRIVALGDNLDLPEMSKYRLSPAFRDTMQAAIDYATTLFARIRAAAPTAEIIWLAGNHEERLSNYTLDNAIAAYGLRQGTRPEGWPVLSVPHLCRLDDVNVTYKPGYPASDVWITKNLKIIHGNRVKSGGSTAHKYLAENRVSIVFGHIHRIERAHLTRWDHDGASEIMAASPGCLARNDGSVPSTNQGLDLDGRPLPSSENWQTGLAIITNVGDEFDYEQVRIDKGRAWWRGRRYGPEVAYDATVETRGK